MQHLTHHDHPQRTVIAVTEESDGVVITAQHPQQPGLMIGLPVLITWNQLDHVIEDLTAIYAWHRNEQGIYDQ